MLERASTCLETGGRHLLRTPKSCLRNRRALHSTFWRHGGSDLSLPVWWASVGPNDRTDGDIDSTSGPALSTESRKQETQLLDFLYPEKTLALLQRISKYNNDAVETRRKQQLNGFGIRHFSTSPWMAHQLTRKTTEIDGKALQRELEERLREETPPKALQALLDSSQEPKAELAWNMYLSVPEPERSTELRVHLLEYLMRGKFTDPNGVLDVFNALPRSARRASSFRAAISAHLTLGMVGSAVQLLEEAASTDIGSDIDIGTDMVLGSAVQDNQWDLGIRVLKSFMSLASRNHFDLSGLYSDPKRQKSEFNVVWGRVAQLPYLRGHMDNFLVHLQTFSHELQSTEGNREVLRHFVMGMGVETTDQVLNARPVDEDAIGEFLLTLFRRLRTLGHSNAGLYEYVIRRMLQIPRYRVYSNQRKSYLTIYRMYRDECEAGSMLSARPSKELLREMLVQVGKHRSSKYLTKIVGDFRLFYPGKSLPYKMLRYVLDYYAGLGKVDEVHKYFDEFYKAYRPQVDVAILTALPYAYARRVDIEGTEKQFARISQEFGMTPDIVAWNVLLHAYTRADNLDGALVCFNRILESGTVPNVRTFGPLLDLCAARGDIEAYDALYARAEQLNVPIRADVRARAGFVQALLNFDDPEGAEATAQSMLRHQQSGLLQGSLTHTWNMLIQYYALKGDLENTRRLYREMLEMKIPLDEWTYASLMRALIEVKQTNAAYKILRVTMPNNNIQVHAFHYALVIIGFLHERQYKHALHANKRMKDRNVPQTAASRMASLQATAIAELHALKKARDPDPRRRLAEVEKEMREILLSDYQADVALREPSHARLIDARHHSAPEGYFGFLILLYGARGAYDICKELFQAASIARPVAANYEAPITLLTAIMDAHLRAKEYDEVDKCWKLARSQADKLVKTLQQIMDPPTPKPTNDSLLDPEIEKQAANSTIARNRRQVLILAMRLYIRSLLQRPDEDGQFLTQAQRTIKDLLTSGFAIDNIAWNEFIQELCSRGRLIDAFTAFETYLMPEFPGWRNLSPVYIRKDQPGHKWMELRHTDVKKQSMFPRYKTLVVLARAYAGVREQEANGIGYDPEMGGWTREILEKLAPMTVDAIVTMPRTGDVLQRQYLAGLL
ncbi:uncharacterized protein EI97DRAFT_411937 [Westerdykella ornata]|uniref:TPR-like protein n=1 Tax=Westerdykella ornata TaxID=318751 RepID=A0A6A6JTJ5_WESOR|nr:uncharacterized protein EI97DRAFT_411937 [Westerdykella ornata]KAF2279168.1 hypothetical protein EI97DRAFT_411937 [Westerdykella ornata]